MELAQRRRARGRSSEQGGRALVALVALIGVQGAGSHVLLKLQRDTQYGLGYLMEERLPDDRKDVRTYRLRAASFSFVKLA